MASQPRQSQQAAAPQHAPPFPPTYQALGEVPTVLPDVPVGIIFLCLFTATGAAHVVLLRRNIAGGRKFLISVMVARKSVSPIWQQPLLTNATVFCLTRVLANCLRIAWACHPTNVQLGITATVFVYAGIVLLFLANLLLAQRIVRAQHPRFGWSKPFTIFLPVVFVTIIGTILCLIAVVIVGFYTLNPSSRRSARQIQKYGVTMLTIVAFLPFCIVGISSLARRHPTVRKTKTTDKFGEGSMRIKVAIVMISSALLCLGASFRAATILRHPVPILVSGTPPRPAPEPWYLSKACFYIFNFTIEIVVCLFWLAVRIDKRFYIPDGAKGPFSYAGGFIFAGEAGNEKQRDSHRQPDSEQHLAGPSSLRLSTRRPSSHNSRVSLPGSRSSRVMQQTKVANRISWGGVSQEDVRAGVAEDGTEIPYFEHTGRYGTDASEIGVDSIENLKEMGWDPKSGKWAVRPISRISSTRGPGLDSEDV